MLTPCLVAKTAVTTALSLEVVRSLLALCRPLIYDIGHSQKEHETHHGSMSKTRWAVDGPDGTILDLNGRRFAADDDGAPMLCNLFCQEMGRHVHIDYCRTDAGDQCGAAQVQHITARLTPNPNRAKDWISHSLYWSRSGTVRFVLLLTVH